MSSFPEMEIRATVALDGDTRRACNNPACSFDYGHKGNCSNARPGLDTKHFEPVLRSAELANELEGFVRETAAAMLNGRNTIVALRELAEKVANRHVQFMVTGGPVVMAADFDKMKARAESAEKELAKLYSGEIDNDLANMIGELRREIATLTSSSQKVTQ